MNRFLIFVFGYSGGFKVNRILFYTRENCLLCEEALVLLDLFRADYKFEIEIRDIYKNDAWLEIYQLIIPVIEINDRQLSGADINFETLEQLIKVKY